jgi:hypothetical protein
MKKHIVKIKELESLTHDVIRIVTEKPEGYRFEPGQATEVAINQPELSEQRRPFTFTSCNQNPYVEFIVKVYPTDGITAMMRDMKPGEALIIHDVFGAVHYEGPGYFLAGGAGITPFVAIFRSLYRKGKIDGNQLFFANKKQEDVILKEELEKMLNGNAHFYLTRENQSDDKKFRFDNAFFDKNCNTLQDPYYYVCGTPAMTKEVVNLLKGKNIRSEKIIFEH